MPRARIQLLGVLAAASFLLPSGASAASAPFEVSGWIPYWRTATGTADALVHLDVLTEVNPFVYTIKQDGTLVDNGKLAEEPWVSFITTAKAKKLRVIPTVMSGDGTLLHKLLSSAKSRIALEDRIAQLVKQNNFDGIDIDFEGKRAEDRPYFSLFLKGLYQRMGNKWVMCTIESRTPLSDRYFGTTMPQDAGIYANDFKEINKYCDRVRIMAYDQQGIDLALAHSASTTLYAPVADPAWVEKVVNVAAKDIAKKKIMIGIPTYGYEYSVTAYAGNEYVYDILWTFNPGYALPIAAQYGITPYRTPWGEMAFSYTPVNASSTPPSTSVESLSGLATAAAASTYATAYNAHLSFRYMVWSDAQAIADKVNLAKKLGIRGVSIFKIDGGEDPGMWSVLR